MKRWQVLVGVGLLIVLASSWVILRSAAAVADAREAAEHERVAQKSAPPQEVVATTHFLEVGKIYNFVTRHSDGQNFDKCEFLEQSRDGWVKVRVREGASFKRVTVAWLNLNQITYIVPVEEGD